MKQARRPGKAAAAKALGIAEAHRASLHVSADVDHHGVCVERGQVFIEVWVRKDGPAIRTRLPRELGGFRVRVRTI